MVKTGICLFFFKFEDDFIKYVEELPSVLLLRALDRQDPAVHPDNFRRCLSFRDR